MSMFSRFNKKDESSKKHSSKKEKEHAPASDTFDEDMDLSAAKAAIRGKCSYLLRRLSISMPL